LTTEGAPKRTRNKKRPSPYAWHHRHAQSHAADGTKIGDRSRANTDALFIYTYYWENGERRGRRRRQETKNARPLTPGTTGTCNRTQLRALRLAIDHEQVQNSFLLNPRSVTPIRRACQQFERNFLDSTVYSVSLTMNNLFQLCPFWDSKCEFVLVPSSHRSNTGPALRSEYAGHRVEQMLHMILHRSGRVQRNLSQLTGAGKTVGPSSIPSSCLVTYTLEALLHRIASNVKSQYSGPRLNLNG